MKVVILCGGKGTRLAEETEFRPKPLVEIGGRPILWHIMKLYAYYGFKDFILCLGYRMNMFKEYFLNYEEMNNDFTINLGKETKIQFHGIHNEQNFSVTLFDTGLENMTGSRIKQIEPFIDEDNFMVTYGDGLSNVDITKLVEFHRSHGKIGTVTVVRPVSRFGIIDFGKDKFVTSFSEKPEVDAWTNAGFFVFNKKLFDYIGNETDTVLEKTPVTDLSKNNQLAAFVHNGFFYPVDTYREYLALNRMHDKGDVPWMVWK